jgi:hypothetical protein
VSDERNRGGDRPFIRPWEAAPERDVATEHRDTEAVEDEVADPLAADENGDPPPRRGEPD